MTEPIPLGGPSSSGLPHHQPITPPGPTPVAIPERLGAFVLLDKLGEGGMGFVHRGRQEGLDRIVAVKMLTPQLAKDPIFVARFHREAKAAAVLEHPNVVRIYASGEEHGFHYFATEFMAGGSVEDMMATQRLIPPRRALEIVRDVAEALAFAATHGMVHRDIKPGNILLSDQGIAKLADLGLAKRVDSDQSATNLTQAGMIMGTPYYMAPEQALDEGKLDIRADIYALGITLFQMLTGQVPFADPSDEGDLASAMLVMTRKVNKQVPSVRTLNPAIGQPLADLCERMTANDRNQRLPDADTLLAACSALLAGKVPAAVATNQTASSFTTPVPAAASTDPNTLPPNPTAPPRRTPATRKAMTPVSGRQTRASSSGRVAPRRRHSTSGSRRVTRGGSRSAPTSSSRLTAVLAGREQSQIPPWAWLAMGAGVAMAFLLGMAVLGGESAPPQSNGYAGTPSRRARTPATIREPNPAPPTSQSPREPPLRPRREESSADYRLTPPATSDPTPAIEDARPDDPAPWPPDPVPQDTAPGVQQLDSPGDYLRQRIAHLVATGGWAEAMRLADDAASAEQDAGEARRYRTLAAVIQTVVHLVGHKPRETMESLEQIRDRALVSEVATDPLLAAGYQLVLLAESLHAGDAVGARERLGSARETAAATDFPQSQAYFSEAEKSIDSLEALRYRALHGPTANINSLTRDRRQLAKHVDDQLLAVFETVLQARGQLLRPHRDGVAVSSRWAEDLESAANSLKGLEENSLLGSPAGEQISWLAAEMNRALQEMREHRGLWISLGDPASVAALTNKSDEFEVTRHGTRSLVDGEMDAVTLCRLPALRLADASTVKGIKVFFDLAPKGKAPPLLSLQFGSGQGLLIGPRLAALRGSLSPDLLHAILNGRQHSTIGSLVKVKIARDKQASLMLLRAPAGGNRNQMQVGIQQGKSKAPKFLNLVHIRRWGNPRHIDLVIGNGTRVSHLVIYR